MREILGSIAGAIAGATIAQTLGATEQIPVAAIAGAFCGPGIVALILKTIEARRTPRP